MSTEIRQALHKTFHLIDLSSLSISSVGPIFSVAAAGSAMVHVAGAEVPIAIALIAIPFILCSWVFLSLNQHFPNAGASYHWSRRIMGIDYSNFQAWIVIMAYFWSIPPILIPAARFTLGAMVVPHPGTGLQIVVATFWALFAAGVLLFGARITAKVTQIFLFIEMVSVAFMAIVGYSHWGPAVAGEGSFSLRHIHWAGVIVCMVVAATIVDGWEIDSYASEESRNPRLTPGWGGVIGAISVVLYYLLIWPLLLHQVPLEQLQNSRDTLSLWAATVSPQFLPWMRIAIIASTAGGLWLTTFILSRALFAMSRDGVMPEWLGRLNRRHVPVWSIILPILLALAVVLMQVFFPNMRDLFNLVLSAAGFFLVAEFLLDGINMMRFLLLQHRSVRHHFRAHHHAGLLLGSLVVIISLSAVELLFLIYGPEYIAAGIDQTVGVFLLLGVFYVLWLRWRKTGQRIYLFDEVEL
ncbi:MAG: APC family permease [Acidithiobacillus sp.]